MLTDYHLHLRPDDLDATRRRALHARPTPSATATAAERARDRRARRLRAHLPLHAGARGLAPPVLGELRARRPRRLLRVRARADRPAARASRPTSCPAREDRIAEPARGARLRLRGRLGALPARRRRRHGRLQRVGRRAQRRGDLAALLRDARRGGAQRPVRHPRPPRPGEDTGAPSARCRRATCAATTSRRSRRSPSRGSRSRSRRPGCASRSARSTRRRRSSRCALEAGAPVALSSDAHRPRTSAPTTSRRSSCSSELGVRELCVFERRARRLEPIGATARAVRDDARPASATTRTASPPGRRLVLGGVEIPHERGLDGHSDADVLDARA